METNIELLNYTVKAKQQQGNEMDCCVLGVYMYQ
jgi:hypothetical protein